MTQSYNILESNPIGDEGMALILKSVKEDSSIKVLNLSNLKNIYNR